MSAARRAVIGLPRRLGLTGQPFALYLGAGLVSFWVLIALFADVIAPYEPNAHNLREFLQPPSWAHLLGTDNFGREMELNIASSENERIRLIEEAIQRIDEDTYGECSVCDSKINVERLEAVPYTRLCIECARESEKKY